MSLRIIIPLALLFCAQTTVPAGLSSELERLRAQNAQLRQEVVALQAQLASVNSTTRPSTQRSPQTQPATRPVARRFTSMPELLARVPDELRPRPDPDWYKFDHGKFLQWWKSELVGMTFDDSLPLDASVERIGVRSEAPWMVYGSFHGRGFTALGAEHSWSVSFPIRYVNETDARKWNDFKSGTRVHVKGVIADVSIQVESQARTQLRKYRVYLVLRNAEISAP